jgi:hypothetical protein
MLASGAMPFQNEEIVSSSIDADVRAAPTLFS